MVGLVIIDRTHVMVKYFRFDLCRFIAEWSTLIIAFKPQCQSRASTEAETREDLHTQEAQRPICGRTDRLSEQKTPSE